MAGAAPGVPDRKRPDRHDCHRDPEKEGGVRALDLGGEVERPRGVVEQAKIPPGRPHGRKSALQQAVLGALDTLNVPITRAFNALGDRVVMVARRPQP